MNLSMHHTGIFCNNLDESIKFYCDLFGFRLLFISEDRSGDALIRMAMLRNENNIVLELIELDDKSSIQAAWNDLNHLGWKVSNMDDFVQILKSNNIPLEVEPFILPCGFDRPLDTKDNDLFTVYGDKGLQMKVAFFRGPSGERIEVMQDDIAPIE